ncbi:MAG: diguanylate cyclase domain [Verrucomicrobiaceae bacterium]|nr:diguanylate cyclase domain [Verrucomicrobiaceae bacterium]
MGFFRYFLALLCLLTQMALSHAEIPLPEDGKLVLRGDSAQKLPTTLNGEWNYIAGRWVQPDELASIMQPTTVRVPAETRPARAPRLQQSSGTYLLDLLVDAPLAEPAIHFQRICGAATVYLFRAGDLVTAPLARFGKLSDPRHNDMLFNQVVKLPALTAGTYHLLIQQSSLHASASALCGPVELGDAVTMEYTRALGTIKNVTVVALLLGVALGSLLLGSQNGDRAAPWLTLVCIGCALLLITVSGLLSMLLPPEANSNLDRLRIIGCYSALAWLPPALLMLFSHTLSIGLPRWLKVVNIAVPVVLNVVFVVATNRLVPYPTSLVALWGIELCASYAVVVLACRLHRDYAYLTLASSLPLLVVMPVDLYRYFEQGNIEIYTPYAIALLVAVHACIYAMRFGAAYRLAARLSAHLQEEVEIRTRELSTKNQKLEQTQIELQQANETLQQLSITDGLTGVHNRMYFEQQLAQEWRRCSRQGLPLSLLMIDADHFKQLNDSAGHQVGDACLRSVAMEIDQQFKRAGELVARYGGEEFIVLLPDTQQNKALAIAEGLRIAIERMPINHGENEYRVTISIGVSTVTPGMDQQPAQLIATADAALYEAKDAGRNRVHSIPMLGQRNPMATQQQLHL